MAVNVFFFKLYFLLKVKNVINTGYVWIVHRTKHHHQQQQQSSPFQSIDYLHLKALTTFNLTANGEKIIIIIYSVGWKDGFYHGRGFNDVFEEKKERII